MQHQSAAWFERYWQGPPDEPCSENGFGIEMDARRVF